MKDEIKEILDRLEKIGFYASVPKELAYMTTNITPQECKTVLDYITNLQTIEQQYSAILSENAELENKITNLQEENQRLKNNIKSAFEVINTQMKNLSKGEAENLRIIKFNLIKGSCTWGDLTTEEDYKY